MSGSLLSRLNRNKAVNMGFDSSLMDNGISNNFLGILKQNRSDFSKQPSNHKTVKVAAKNDDFSRPQAITNVQIMTEEVSDKNNKDYLDKSTLNVMTKEDLPNIEEEDHGIEKPQKESTKSCEGPSKEGSKKTKKRNRNPAEWKRNTTKILRNSGKEYHSLKNGKLNPARAILTPCTDKCRQKCTSKFSEEDRLHYFNQFWKLGDLQSQRNFILTHMQSIEPKHRQVVLERKKERTLNKAYYLKKNNRLEQVCFTFFRSTLGVSERFVRTVKAKEKDGFLDKDLRGKKKHSNVEEEIKIGMRQHLESIPVVARTDTEKRYIDGGKTLVDLYKDYVDGCKKKDEKCGKFSLYRHLFNYDFNMCFHKPKKTKGPMHIQNTYLKRGSSKC